VSDAALVEVAGEADVLVITMPLTDASRGIIGREVIAALSDRAWLINVSRGPLVNEPALLAALRAGRLAGAVLDVFGEEPLARGSATIEQVLSGDGHDRSEWAIEVSYEGSCQMDEGILEHPETLDEVLAPLGRAVASVLVRIGDLPFTFRPSPASPS